MSDISNQFKKDSQGKPIDQKLAKDAFDFNKEKVQKQGLKPTDPNYWKTVTGDTMQDLEMFPDTETYKNKGFNPRGGNSEPNKIFPENYTPFEKELEKSNKKSNEELKAYTRIEQAKKVIKDLKDKKLSRNEIVYTLNQRLGISIADAISLYDGKEDLILHPDQKVDPTDPLVPSQQNDALSDVSTFSYDLQKSKKKQ